MTKSKTPTYAELKQELDIVLETLQQGDIDVDDALKAYEKGMTLIKLLEAKLKSAENKINKVKVRFEG
jgi:exodeoxyribonuclease VII small subunit